MRSFAQYFLERQLSQDEQEIITENVSNEFSVKKFVKHAKRNLKAKQVEKLSEKHPNIQYEDIEEAFEEAIKKMLENKPDNEASAQKMLRKALEEEIGRLRGKKKSASKNLSCIKAIKSELGDNAPIHQLMRRAEKVLTAQEKKVLKLCAQGKSVRAIGQELKISFPTAWRALNSGVDKIRVCHGMRSRHKDLRKRK